MTSTHLRVGLVQCSSPRDPDDALPALADQIRAAAGRGAKLILTPENCAMLEPVPERARAKAAPEQDHPAVALFAQLAQETGAWLLAGSIAVKGEGGKLHNRSLLFAADGSIAARYDKIHLFDVQLLNGEVYRESATYAPGERAVAVATPWGGLGLTICYDVRFPHLYRSLAQAGARMIAVPAAFTRPTGQAHWRTLLRARAIETGCFILAPAQCGTHAEGRATWGHSMIVSPWGEVLSTAGEEPDVIACDLEFGAVDDARARIPQLTHDRAFVPPVALV